MKRHHGIRFLLFALLAVIIVKSSARPFHFAYDPDPAPPPPQDSPVAKKGSIRDSLRFPIADKTGNPAQDAGHSNGFDLHDPENMQHGVDYDPSDKHYYLTEKIGDEFIRNPAYLTFDEYQKYSARQDEQAYWKQRLDALTLFNKKPTMPTMYKQGIFDRIFGSNTIQVKPQGNVDVSFGINSQNIKNPTLVQRAQKYSIFDFDMQMNINLLATVGDKLKLNISNNTKATFDYQNVQKLEYTGKEDEILKKLELGNISFPLKTTLMQGVQSLFGVKTQLQFGKLWVTAALSQQKSKRQSITIQGGAQTQSFGLKADDYEENKHFLLAQYFHDRYNTALARFPVINSQVTINKIEVWVTNRTGAVDGVRQVICFQDLGEKNPYYTALASGGSALPDNRSNSLYDKLLQQQPASRQTGTSTTIASGIFGVSAAVGSDLTDFAPTTARKLNASEYTFNPQLGYISLNTQVNPDDVLGVAYQYTSNGKVYKVGEFAEDLPPDTTNQKVLYLKMLKNVSPQPALPIWKLMMKNVYALGGLGVSKEDFRLNVLYQDPGGGEKRYIPEPDIPNPGTPLLTLLNLDRLNFQNDPSPDGVFDYVEGITILPQQGKIIFPVLEPFGHDLAPALGPNPQLQRKYLYNILYDSTKTVARQFQQNNRFIMRGSYKSSSSSEIFLGGFNIPPGSVTVSAGGQKLAENADYQIDYGLGRLKILNSGILSSGIPINVSYEDNATFGFQQQNFMGARFDYYANNKLTLGGTVMRLTERPFTQKTSFGEDPIKNTQIGLDGSYQSEFPGLTKLLDKLPIYSTTASSFITASAEVASLLPGHPKAIDALDPEGSVYIDDFEGTRSSYDLKFPAAAWSLASVPLGAKDARGQTLFPEAALLNDINSGKNRARLAWYFIEPSLVDPTGGVPDFVKNDSNNQHYIRLVQQQEVFPDKSYATLQNALSTFDLTFFPKKRGPYNFDATKVDKNGDLTDPASRWGGIMRALDYSDFEQSNVEYVEFWMLDPFINRPNLVDGGSLYVNLGNVSEDVLKDGRKFFENGIQNPKDPAQLDKTNFGYVPRFQQQITRAFDNDPAARAVQDVGYDGADNNEERTIFFNKFLSDLSNTVGPGTPAFNDANTDPASDDYHYFRGSDYDNANLNVLARYKYYNNPQGNSPVPDATAAFSSAATTVPESEDIDRDNTLNETENYYQYRIDLKPGGLNVGSNYVVSTYSNPGVKLPNGSTEPETWYQFKVPIRDFNSKVGDIADFRSIRFMRMFMTGFADSVTLRLAALNLGRNQWRRYNYSLKDPGENIPDDEQRTTDFTVTSVSVEENSKRTPIPYVIPPGVSRQLTAVANGQTTQQNEQSLDLQVCTLKDGDARAAYKEVNVDMRQFGRLRMFVHGESMADRPALANGDVRAFIRVGSDFISNYYEYEIPLHITQPGATDENAIWPQENLLDIALDDLVRVKTERNNQGLQAFIPYESTDSKGNIIRVIGNPNVGEAKTIMLGILNPKKDVTHPQDDGLGKCAEVWFDELRMTGLNEKASYAATAKVNLQLADLGSAHVGGSMHTVGYGNIDQKLEQRSLDNATQWDANTNLALGKLLPRSWGVQLPFFLGHSQSVSNPEYNPYDLDVKYKDQLDAATSAAQRDSLKKVAQDYTSITSFNFSNVRILGSPDKQKKTKPWSAKNFDLSYSYNRQFKRNPLIESDELLQQRLGIGYSYNIASKSFEPFKKLIKSRNKWYSLIKDFNFKPLPSNFTFRTELNRIMDETQVRNVGDGAYAIPPTFYKNFTWLRTYSLRWELTKSLSFDYNATNNSRIDEPYGRVNTAEKRDSLWNNIKTFGRNTLYTQAFNASYALPFAKIPIFDWVNFRVSYGSTYNWTAASLLATSLGNTINNTQTKSATGELNFSQLYNKSRFLRAAIAPRQRSSQKPANNNLPGRDKAGPGRPGDPGVRGGKDGRGGPPKESASGADGSSNANSTAGTSTPDNKDKDSKGRPAMLDLHGVHISTANMSDHELDSLSTLIRKDEIATKKGLAKKAKADRRNARKARRARNELSTVARAAGRIVTSVKRVTVAYSEQGATLLPGYLDSTKVFGVNPASGNAPGLGFAFGDQPGLNYLEQQGAAGRLSKDTLFNAQFNQTYANNINVTAQIEPIPNDLSIALTLTSTFSKSHNELYKYLADSTGQNAAFYHLNPYETGAFNISYISLKTLFQSGGSKAAAYQDFLTNRQIVSDRLGNINPYTHGVRDPLDTGYAKGYNRFSQDALIPAFIAAYSGRSAANIPLIDYSNSSIKSNPFHNYFPLPNWRITYNGLSRLPLFRDIFNSFTVSDAYTANLTVSSYVSSLFYEDIFALGHPSFIDSTSGNYIPYFQVPNISITEAFGPLIGVDMALKNNLTARFEFRKSRQVALSLIDYQVSETRSQEIIVGAGYRVRGLQLPFAIFGVRKLKNDLNVKLDIGVRDDITSNSYLAQNIEVVTRGQRVLSISPSVDYIVNDNLTLRFFYDRRQSIPYISSSYPITTTKAGVTLRFIFAQ